MWEGPAVVYDTIVVARTLDKTGTVIVGVPKRYNKLTNSFSLMLPIHN